MKDGLREFLVDFYAEKANEEISQEKINSIIDSYGDQYDSLINDLYDKYDKGNINPKKISNIKNTYQFDLEEEVPGSYVIDGKNVQGYDLEEKLYTNDFIDKLQAGEVDVKIEGNEKMQRLLEHQLNAGSELSDRWEALQKGSYRIINFPENLASTIFDLYLSSTDRSADPFNTEGKSDFEKALGSVLLVKELGMQNKLKKLNDKQRKYEEGFLNNIGKGNISEAASIGFNSTIESAPITIASLATAYATGGSSALAQVAATSGTISSILFPDYYMESKYSEDKDVQKLTTGQKVGRAALFAAAEGIGEAIPATFIGVKNFKLLQGGFKRLFNKAVLEGGEEAGEQVAKNLGKETAVEIFKGFGLDAAGEGVSEAITQLSQDITDNIMGVKNYSFDDMWERSKEAFSLGTFSGGTIAGMGAAGKVMLRSGRVEQGAISQVRKAQKEGLVGKEEGDALIQKIKDLKIAIDKTDTNLSIENQEKVSDLIYEKNIIEKSIEGLDINQKSVKDAKARIKEINDEISNISGITQEDVALTEQKIKVGEEFADIKLDRTILFAESQGKKLGKKVYIVESDATKTSDQKAQEIYDEFVRENPGTKQMDVSGTDGFYIGDRIVINKDVARKTGAISVGSHEVLHGVINNVFESLEDTQKEQFIKDFRKILSKEQLDVIDQRFETYKKSDPNFNPNTSVEIFTALSDAIQKNQITFNESFGNKIKNLLQEILRRVGLVKDFSNARQAYNFLKDYNKSVNKGRLGRRALKLAEAAPTVKQTKPSPSMTTPEIVAENNRLRNELSEALEVDDDIKVNDIKNDLFLNNQGTIQEFINNKFKPGLGITKEEFERGVSSEVLLKLNNTYTPAKGDYGAYIREALFGGGGFGGGRLGNILKDLGQSENLFQESLDTEQARQIQAEDTSTKETRTEKQIRQAERKGVKVREKVAPVYKVDKTVKSIRSKAKQQDMRGKTLKQLKGFGLREVVDMIARDDKALADSMFRKIETNSDLNKSEMLAIQNFINSNVDLGVGSLLEGYTSEFKATGVVNKLLEKFYNKRSVRAKTGPGLQVQIKKPNINPTEFKEAFGIIGKDRTNWNQKVPARKGGVSDILKGFVRNLDQVISSQEIREQYIADGDKAEALNTLKDGMPSGYFSKTENLGKVYRALNLEQQTTFMGGFSQFIERMAIGQDAKVAFINTYGDNFLTKGKSNELTIKGVNLIEEFQKVLNNFPKQEFVTEPASKKELNDYLYEAFEEQNDRLEVQEILGINKEGVNFGNVNQIESFKDALLKIFKFNRSRFDNDLDFFKWALQHYETLTAPAKIGSLPNHIWVENSNGVWKLVEGKESGRSASVRYGIFNNKSEFLNILLKPFDNSNALTYQKNKGFFYNNNKIEITRAKQSNEATKSYLKEFIETGRLSNKTLNDSYKDAIGNQEEIIRVLNFYKENKGKPTGISLNDLGMYFISSTGDMTSILRSAYYIDSIALSDSTNPNDYRFEHNPPVRVMKIYMAQYVKGDITEQQLKEKFADSSVSVIPKDMDDVINIRYKDSIPLAYVNRFSRYFNTFSFGKFPFEMTVYTPTIKNGQVVSWKKSIRGKGLKAAYESIQKAKESNIEELSNSVASFSRTMTNDEVLSYAATLDNALANARKLKAPVKKIRVFDFDDTLAQTKSIVFYTKPDGTEGQLTAEEFAEKGAELVAEGAVMDFSDFNIVRDGKRGPLFDIAKKIKDARGNEDLFVLTARAPESQNAIYEFLKSEGLQFKRKNIIGLGNSTGAAKAQWIIGKASEGYNDFYFADDAYANVQAVQDALDQIDVKSQVQQAKISFSKSINESFNKIIEQTTGIASEKRYSKAKAKVRGAGKGNKKFFIPYSAEDFMGLIYPLLSKDKLGDSQMAWFKEHLLDPYGRAIENLSRDRIQMMQDFKQLKKSLEVPKDLRKINDSGFTNEQAVRVYLFDKMGYDVPGLSKADLKELVDIINSDGKLKAFADQILSLTKGDGYVKPTQEWLAGTITTDLIDLLNTTKRRKYLEQSGFLDNANEIFSEENLNKLEAAYGSKYREALENILSRMKSGKNRIFSGNRLSNRVLDYINGSIGTIMFFNTRSAVLQTISSINFLNWSFNNPIKAGKAFANQAQYWKDFKMLMNSDYLTDRRNGLKLNINENEIANAAATAKNKARGVMNYILQKGYLPTQFADSFAIASGGATFYRNRVNDLVKKGLSIKEAEQQALSEWKETAEISQQSSDPSKISQQQASDLGRVILAFANTPMQYARIQKRAYQDLVNGRGDAKANVSKIIYYGFVQNLIFNALQQAIFAIGFGDDDDEKNEKKYFNTANGMLDSLLRGIGIAGATTAVIKNFLLDIYERSDRKRPEYVDAVYKLLQISPPISSKISKIRQAAYQFDSKKRRQEIFEKGFSIDNPAYEAAAKVISATTNLPLDRLINKANNIEAALSEDVETWQRVAMLAGWPEWQIMPKEKTKKGKKQEVKEVLIFDTYENKNTSKVEDVEVKPKITKPKRRRKFKITYKNK